jgi:hypothetical protein
MYGEGHYVIEYSIGDTTHCLLLASHPSRTGWSAISRAVQFPINTILGSYILWREEKKERSRS